MTFSLATNACLTDTSRITHTIPSWLRVFGDRLAEVVIVLDLAPPTGRIARLHGGSGSEAELWRAVEGLARMDSRIKAVRLPPADELRQVSARWFRWGNPVRCQAGTPIGAFLYGIEHAAGPLVLRCDCDVLFCEQGWLGEAAGLLASSHVDLVEPPHAGLPDPGDNCLVSTRAFLLMPDNFRRLLPIAPHRLDLFRRIHRRFRGRPTWLALEQMLEAERQAGRLRHRVLGGGGFSLHMARRDDFLFPAIDRVIASSEAGRLPERQRQEGWNFAPGAWLGSG
jgi:hypothetical protein